MTDPRSAEDIFSEVAARPVEERADFLDGACGEDASLRARVERLLAAQAHAEPPAEGPGSRIGPYQLLRKIGSGGFGVVYMAEQRSPIRRKVALKIIKLGMDTEQVIARFEAERQALALMDHPGIARVLDAGATDSGRPYFVMELVKGVSITEYCDKNKLTTRERLALFVEVCHAVQHAHQKGVIHRDLKPTNVMVTLHGGTPIPKVIDFGIAKATNQRLTERTLFTEYRQFVGTPAYMSPEQAEMSDLDVDTRSDIYSLGVLLYELLTGTPPFDSYRLQRLGQVKIQQIICEEEPPKPSTRVSTMGEAAVTVARKRGAEADALVKSLRGDLDWIVMKALEKNRTRRYRTASELGKDVVRHLEDEAVLAGPPSATYRMGKLIRRHRKSVAAAGAAALALLLGTFGTGLALVAANRAKNDLDRALTAMTAQRNRAIDAERRAKENAEMARAAAADADAMAGEARENADIAVAINDFLNHDLLAAVAPSTEEGKGKDVLVRDALDAAAKRIDAAAAPEGRLAGKPAVEAEIRRTIGRTYWQLGRFPDAARQLERSARVAARHHGKEARVTVATLHELGSCLLEAGRYPEAEPLLLRVALINRRRVGDSHPDTANALFRLGSLYSQTGRLREAEATLTRALEGLGSETGEGRLRCMIKRTLGFVSMRQGDWGRAERLLRQVVRHYTDTNGPDDVWTLMSRCDLAGVLLVRNRVDEAEKLLEGLREAFRRVFGVDHPNTLGAMYTTATVLWKKGRREESRRLYEETLSLRQKKLGPGHIDTLKTAQQLGKLLLELERIDRAREVLEAGVREARRSLPKDHPVTMGFLECLAGAYMLLREYEKAALLAVETFETERRVHGRNHRITLLAHCRVGLVYSLMDRDEEALAVFLDVLDRGGRTLGERHPLVRNAREQVAKSYEKLGCSPADRPVDAEILNLRLAAAAGPGATADEKHEAAVALLEAERPELRDDSRALALARAANDMTGNERPEFLTTLARALERTGEAPEARRVRERARALSGKTQP